jgi:hypothetical protein
VPVDLAGHSGQLLDDIASGRSIERALGLPGREVARLASSPTASQWRDRPWRRRVTIALTRSDFVHDPQSRRMLRCSEAPRISDGPRSSQG